MYLPKVSYGANWQLQKTFVLVILTWGSRIYQENINTQTSTSCAHLEKSSSCASLCLYLWDCFLLCISKFMSFTILNLRNLEFSFMSIWNISTPRQVSVYKYDLFFKIY